MFDQQSTLIGQVLIFVATVLGFAVQAWRESRGRAWVEQDRQRIAKEDEEKRLALAHEAEEDRRRRAEEVAQKVEEKSAELEQKLDENTAISKNAFHEANTVNAKLADIGERFDQLRLRHERLVDTHLDKIDGTGVDTNVRVRKIEDRVTTIEDGGNDDPEDGEAPRG